MLNENVITHENLEGNFLSRIRIDEEREFIRYHTNLMCKVQNFKGMRCQPPIKANVRNISQGGALVIINVMAVRGDHIYLRMENYPFRLGAAVVEITDNGYHVKFIKSLGKRVTERIAKGLPYNAVLKAEKPIAASPLLAK